jgi:hypothetical protein
LPSYKLEQVQAPRPISPEEVLQRTLYRHPTASGVDADAENALEMCTSLAMGRRAPGAPASRPPLPPTAPLLRNITNTNSAAATEPAAAAANPTFPRIRAKPASTSQQHSPTTPPAVDAGPSLAVFVKAARAGLDLLNRCVPPWMTITG